jgi:hypothetical protein
MPMTDNQIESSAKGGEQLYLKVREKVNNFFLMTRFCVKKIIDPLESLYF